MTVTKDLEANSHTSDELSALTGVPRRTIRYYIQMGLVPAPEGETRAARYTAAHLERLLAVQRWAKAGLSLEAIKELIDRETSPDLPEPRRQVGSVEVLSHVLLSDGVELVVDAGRAGLSPKQLRSLARRCLEAMSDVTKEQEE